MRKLIRFLLTIIGWPMEREYKMRIANTNFLKHHMPVIAVNGGKIEKGDQVQAYVKAGPGPKRWLEGLVIDVSGDMVQVGIPGQKSGVLVRKGLVKKLRAMKGSVYKKKFNPPAPFSKGDGLARDNGVNLTQATIDEQINLNN